MGSEHALCKQGLIRRKKQNKNKPVLLFQGTHILYLRNQSLQKVFTLSATVHCKQTRAAAKCMMGFTKNTFTKDIQIFT